MSHIHIFAGKTTTKVPVPFVVVLASLGSVQDQKKLMRATREAAPVFLLIEAIWR